MSSDVINAIKKELPYMSKIKEEINNIKVKVKKRLLIYLTLPMSVMFYICRGAFDFILSIEHLEFFNIICIIPFLIVYLFVIYIISYCLLFLLINFINSCRKNLKNKNSQIFNFLKKHLTEEASHLILLNTQDLQPISEILSHISTDNLEIYHSISSDLDLNGDDKGILSKILSKMFLNENTIDFHKYKSYSEIIINESLNFDLFIEKTFSFFCDKASNQDFSKNANDILNLISNINNAPIKNKSLEQYKDKKNITLMINNTDDEIEIERQKNKTKKPINKIISI